MTSENTADPKALLNKEFKVLDHGFVRLVDYMGDDAAVVQAARVSYGAGTKKVSEDRGLIRYLMRHRHTTPFEMVEFKFHVKLPIFVARQWIRHRTANVNELSGRYSKMSEEFYCPEREEIREQATDNKQGRSEAELTEELKDRFLAHQKESQQTLYGEYHRFMEAGLARELARINLPLSLYTEWYWKIDLHNLFHFLSLRMDRHAQKEIRVYAEVMAEMVKAVCPLAWEAFEDYRLNAVALSRPEIKALFGQLGELPTDTAELAKGGLSKREARELRQKIKRIESLREDSE